MMNSMVFPVVVYDGVRETDMGHSMQIHHMFDYEQFQTMLRETIGFFCNDLFKAYLVERDASKFPSQRPKIRINGKTDFSVLVCKWNSYVRVQLKRSRTGRRREQTNGGGFENVFAPPVSEEYYMYLSQKKHELIYEDVLRLYGSYDRIDEWRMKKENWRNVALKWWNQLFPPPLHISFPGAEEAVEGGGRRALCKECEEAETEGKKAEFHFCINDEVVQGGFRSTAGPICRPV